jgi:hypothetical protein
MIGAGAGGFFVGADSSSQASGGGTTTHLIEAQVAEPLLHLSPRQEGKLRAHLDAKLLGLERDERKK